MSKHTIEIKEVKTSYRTVHLETDKRHPEYEDLLSLVALAIDSVSFDQTGHEKSTDTQQTIDGVDIDKIDI